MQRFNIIIDNLWTCLIPIVREGYDNTDTFIRKDFIVISVILKNYIIKNIMFSKNQDPQKMIVQLQIGLEIALFSKSILSVLLKKKRKKVLLGYNYKQMKRFKIIGKYIYFISR